MRKGLLCTDTHTHTHTHMWVDMGRGCVDTRADVDMRRSEIRVEKYAYVRRYTDRG